MSRWEYKTIMCRNFENIIFNLTHNLTQLGDEGWKLITIYDNMCFFKREKSHDNPAVQKAWEQYQMMKRLAGEEDASRS